MGGWPSSMSTLAWITPPAAPPPGRIFAAALPASWAVAVVPQPTRGAIVLVARRPAGCARPRAGASASFVNHQSDTSRPSWRPARTKNQGTSTRASCGQAANIVTRLGATT